MIYNIVLYLVEQFLQSKKIHQVFCIGFKNYYLKHNLSLNIFVLSNIQRSNHLGYLKIKTKRLQNKEKNKNIFNRILFAYICFRVAILE